MIPITQLVPHAPAILLALGLVTQPAQADTLSLRDCGLSLTSRAGLSPTDGAKVLDALDQYSVINTPEFLRYLYAVAYVESRFRADRRSEADAVGLLQVTLQAALFIHDQRRLVGLRPNRSEISGNRLAYTQINVNIGSSYLFYALTLAGNWPGAIVTYNSGPGGLLHLQRGDKIPEETAQYVTKVLYLAETCGKWDSLRKKSGKQQD